MIRLPPDRSHRVLTAPWARGVPTGAAARRLPASDQDQSGDWPPAPV